jgi:SAM-dependent methyltransferase
MNSFQKYSQYYDLFYRDKDYETEAGFVDKIIKNHLPDAKTILEFGCGTGLHASKLADRGYQVHGVDSSDQMLAKAQKNRAALNPQAASSVSFLKGDIRALRISDRFDVVIALFHVISYLPTNSDINEAFECARSHLRKGGIFLFDCWYGPAVLTDRPQVRIKRIENDKVKVVRIAEPEIFENSNLVDIKYQVFIQNKLTSKLEIIEETHRLRYLFKPEVIYFLNEAGLELVESAEWMTGKNTSFNSWYVYFVGSA